MARPSGVRVEIRPGEGGDDAAHFAQELTAAFTAYARKNDCTITRKDSDRTFVLLVEGQRKAVEVFDRFGGIHRIQRVPLNDKRGRRHTSTASVAVLPMGAETVTELREADIDEIAARGSGPGGQHRNTSDTKITVTHRPTGMTVTINRGRSQWHNRQAARQELARRLATVEQAGAVAQVDKLRSDQIAATDRSAKSFTHNTQRNEVIDHDSGQKWRLDQFLSGRLA